VGWLSKVAVGGWLVIDFGWVGALGGLMIEFVPYLEGILVMFIDFFNFGNRGSLWECCGGCVMVDFMVVVRGELRTAA